MIELLAIPIIAAVLSLFVGKSRIVLPVVCLLALCLFLQIVSVNSGYYSGVDEFHFLPNISLRFFFDELNIKFTMMISCLWFVTMIYSLGEMKDDAHRSRFYFFFSLSIFATLGIAFAGNLITMFVFYELLTIFTYPLVTHKQNKESQRAGRVYLLTLMGASLLFLFPAIIWTMQIAGSGDFMQGGMNIGGILPATLSGKVISILLLLYVFGLAKSAIMPLHSWLPSAMVAPTSVSALLHAVAVVKAGVFCIIKVVIYVFGIENLSIMSMSNWHYGGWLVYFAGTVVIVASLIALKQDNLKRRLAYSTISQLSYIIMTIGIFSKHAIDAAMLHIISHGFGKITLFFVSGILYQRYGKTLVSQMNGVGRSMPGTMIAFTIASLSIIGIPPMIGFFSKWQILYSSLEHEMLFVAVVLIVSTILNSFYLLPISYRAFLKGDDGTVKSDKDIDNGCNYFMVIPVIATALGLLLISLTL